MLSADDPREALARELTAASDLTSEERAWLEAIDPDGLVMSGLLVKKLRFSQLTGAAPELADLFRDRPEEFLRLFDEYTAQIPPEYFPRQEAERFRDWLASR